MARGEVPSVRCAGCHQGFHEACLENQEDLKWHMLLLCPQCKPYFRVMTTKGGRNGRERPRASRRSIPGIPVTTADPQAAAEVAAPLVQAVQDSQGEPISEGSENSANVIPDPPPHPPDNRVNTDQQSAPVHSEQGVNITPNVVPVWVPGSPVCEALLRGDCPHGITGRTGGTCPHPHPKRCDKFLTWGQGGERGCDGSTCGKFHPEVCPSSKHLQCFDRNCKWKIHTRKCRRPGQPDNWQVQEPRGRPQGGGRGGAQGRQCGGGQEGAQGRQQGGGRRQHGGGQVGQGNQNSLFQLLTARQSQPGAIEEQLQTLISLIQMLAPPAKTHPRGRGGRNPSY